MKAKEKLENIWINLFHEQLKETCYKKREIISHVLNKIQAEIQKLEE